MNKIVISANVFLINLFGYFFFQIKDLAVKSVNNIETKTNLLTQLTY